MEHRTLQQTQLSVSRICFGTMTFGKPVQQAEAAEMVATCLDAGVTFFDTANAYQAGASEDMLGKALGPRRKDVVVATKIRNRMGEGPEQVGLSRKAVIQETEACLRRLRTDYVDLLYLHQPDYEISIDETLEAVEDLVQTGKVRIPATSNYASWQVCQMLHKANARGFRPASVAQQMYNLLARGLEQEFLPMAADEHVSTVVYNPLAGGLLTGKHSADQMLAGTRFDDNKMYQDRYWHAEDFRAVARLQEIASGAGRSLVSLALNWLLHHTPVDAVVLGASRLEQLQANLQAVREGPLTQEVSHACDEVWKTLRGPVPQYNR